MNGTKYILLIALTIATQALNAQDDGQGGNEQINIIQNYKPILADAVKMRFNPQIPEATFEKPDLTYNLPSRSLDLPYSSPEVRPLAMKPLPLKPLKNVYAKVGAGNKALPFIDFYANSGRNQKYINKTNSFNWGVHGSFINAPAGIENQAYSELRSNGFVQYYIDKVALSGEVNYNQDNVRFYGYNHTDTSLPAGDVKQTYHFINGAFQINNARKTSYSFDYLARFDFNYLFDIRQHREINPIVKGMLNKRFKDGNDLRVNLLLDYTGYTFDTAKVNRTILSVNPWYRLNKDVWYVRIGLNGGVDEAGFYIFPDVVFQRELIGKALIFYSGWFGGIEKNNLKTLSDVNPFLADTLVFRNSRVQDRFMGFKGGPSQRMLYDVHFSQKVIDYLPLFRNNAADTSRFDIIYDTATVMLDMHGEVSYAINEKFRVLISGDFYNYSLRNEVQPWHLPTLKGNLNATWQMNEKLGFSADVYALNKTFARSPSGQVTTLKGVVDINLGATYKFSDSFHIFANVNNVASIRHERWYGYPGYGFNAMGGLIMNF